ERVAETPAPSEVELAALPGLAARPAAALARAISDACGC
ncbi:CoA-transferase subunit beta, partial [Pseudomonas aeruginosa]|nr:CoA-transferase subunit beta [Pseudomonas aeruginosa]